MYRLLVIAIGVIILTIGAITVSAQEPIPTTVPGDDIAGEIVDLTVETAEEIHGLRHGPADSGVVGQHAVAGVCACPLFTNHARCA